MTLQKLKKKIKFIAIQKKNTHQIYYHFQKAAIFVPYFRENRYIFAILFSQKYFSIRFINIHLIKMYLLK